MLSATNIVNERDQPPATKKQNVECLLKWYIHVFEAD
jgi:hypothetical protein